MYLGMCMCGGGSRFKLFSNKRETLLKDETKQLTFGSRP